MPKVVLPAEEAERVAMAYSPQKFPFTVSKVAHEFVAFNSRQESSSFQIDRLVAEQTGISEIERLSIEEKVEREALGRVKDLQEKAYQEAYQLGLDEGREQAFLERQSELDQSLNRLNGLLNSIERMKSELVAANETQIVSLIYYIARRLVLREIDLKPELILEVIRQAVMSAQSEEGVTVRLSSRDFQFVDGIRKKLGKDFDFMRRVKLDASDDVVNGGCIVETNFGEVNSTLDQRLEKLWAALSEKMPKMPDVIGASQEAEDNPVNSGDPSGQEG